VIVGSPGDSRARVNPSPWAAPIEAKEEGSRVVTGESVCVVEARANQSGSALCILLSKGVH